MLERRAATESETAPTAELLRKALEDVQELARAEVALAGKELGDEVRGALITAIAIAASIAVGICAVAAGVAALIVAFGGTLVAAFGTAAAILAVAAASGIALTLARLPKSFLPRTRRRVAQDITEMKDHLA
ncbi:MAG TPA: phage holin family protein [Polyangiaceae bacterium]|jgi:hypothetical protein|nr:phage holin family protein [Polyangiaceae bacterium]